MPPPLIHKEREKGEKMMLTLDIEKMSEYLMNQIDENMEHLKDMLDDSFIEQVKTVAHGDPAEFCRHMGWQQGVHESGISSALDTLEMVETLSGKKFPQLRAKIHLFFWHERERITKLIENKVLEVASGLK